MAPCPPVYRPVIPQIQAFAGVQLAPGTVSRLAVLGGHRDSDHQRPPPSPAAFTSSPLPVSSPCSPSPMPPSRTAKSEPLLSDAPDSLRPTSPSRRNDSISRRRCASWIASSRVCSLMNDSFQSSKKTGRTVSLGPSGAAETDTYSFSPVAADGVSRESKTAKGVANDEGCSAKAWSAARQRSKKLGAFVDSRKYSHLHKYG